MKTDAPAARAHPAAGSGRQQGARNVAPLLTPPRGWDALRHDGSLPEGTGDSRVLRRDAFFRRSLALVDAVAAATALVLALGVLGAGISRVHPVAVCLIPFVVLVNKALGLYDRDQHQLRKTTVDEAPAILHVSVLYALVVWLGEGLLATGPVNRREVFGLAVVTFVLMVVGRVAARTFALAVTLPERCVVLGNAGSAARIAGKLETASAVNAIVVGRVALDDGRYAERPDAPRMLGRVDMLPIVLAEHEIERVIIAPDGHDQEQVLAAIRLIKAIGIKVSVLPQLLEVVGSASTFDEIDGITLLGVRRYGLSQSSAWLKRAFDLAASVAGVVLLAFLFLMLAAAIKIDSRGPVFFRQRRIGLKGVEFYMLKFRSMVSGADAMKDDLREHNEAEGLFKITADPRITRVGQFLRQTSLDELPQLLNVVKGDMSLVGPRPLVPDEDAMIEGWQRRRLAVKPGMTGLWQIFGSSRIPMGEMVKIDYLYGANWSLWLDIKILLRTVPYVVTRRGR